jgi:hypothetical protein
MGTKLIYKVTQPPNDSHAGFEETTVVVEEANAERATSELQVVAERLNLPIAKPPQLRPPKLKRRFGCWKSN